MGKNICVIFAALVMVAAAPGAGLQNEAAPVPLSKCLYYRIDSLGEPNVSSTVYCVDLLTGDVRSLFRIDRFEIDGFAVNAEWREIVVGGYEIKESGLNVAVYCGGIKGGRPKEVLQTESVSKRDHDSYGTFDRSVTIIFDENDDLFYIGAAQTYYGRPFLEMVKAFEKGHYAMTKTFLYEYKPGRRRVKELGEVPYYVELRGVEGDDRLSVIVSYYRHRSEPKNAVLNTESLELVFPAESFEDKLKGPGIILCITTPMPEEGSPVSGAFFNADGTGKEFEIAEKVLGEPFTLWEDFKLVYLVKDPETGQPKLKVNYLERGKEIAFELPWDASPPTTSRYKLLMVE